MPCIVRWELRLRVVIDADQITDRIAVFDSVQAAHGDTSGIGVGGIDTIDIGFDPLFDPLLFRPCRLAHSHRRHQSALQVFQNPPKEFPILLQRRVRFDCIERHPAGFYTSCVTRVTVPFEKRLNILMKLRLPSHVCSDETMACLRRARRDRESRKQRCSQEEAQGKAGFQILGGNFHIPIGPVRTHCQPSAFKA